MKATDEALIKAAKEGSYSAVKLALIAGADPNAKDEKGDSVLKIAAYTGKSAMAKLLLENGADTGYEQFNDLIKYCIIEDEKSAISILKKNPGLAVKGDRSGNIAITFCILNWNYLLLEKVASVMDGFEYKNKYGNTPLIIAAERGNIRAVRILLSLGADVNALNNTSDSALSYACLRGHADVAKMLIKHGADINNRNRYDDTPMVLAALSGNTVIIRHLHEAGADINSRGFWGKTPLMMAALKGYADAVKVMIELGADVKMSDIFGYNALMEAAGEVNLNIVENMLKGAGAQGKKISESVKEGYAETVKELLEAGTDINAEDSQGLKACDIAKDEDLKRLISEYTKGKDS